MQGGFTVQMTDSSFTAIPVDQAVEETVNKDTQTGAKEPMSDINVFRYHRFCASHGKIEGHKLLPCADCLYKHCQRACYQAGIWKRALETNPEVPSPIGRGWTLNESGTLTVDWMDGKPAPDAVLELMACSCTRVCKAPKCKCIVNGFPCTHMCKLPSCSNMKANYELDDPVDIGNEFEDDVN